MCGRGLHLLGQENDASIERTPGSSRRKLEVGIKTDLQGNR